MDFKSKNEIEQYYVICDTLVALLQKNLQDTEQSDTSRQEKEKMINLTQELRETILPLREADAEALPFVSDGSFEIPWEEGEAHVFFVRLASMVIDSFKQAGAEMGENAECKKFFIDAWPLIDKILEIVTREKIMDIGY